jgi:ABC-type nitrate/sulfonate/bicarbonate transport system ATPase subunit
LEPRFAGARHAPPRIAMVFQEPTLLPWRTAAQNLCLPCGITRPAADDWLVKVGLAGLGDRFPAQLSLGQQRRLALARAFAAAPDLLLMDEAFVSLDETLRQGMIEVFATLRAARPLTTILVTHDEREAARLATRVIRLSGTPARITENRPNTTH